MPALLMLKFENVATPATAAAVAVPVSVPLDGVVPMAIVTWFVAVVTTLPCASSMLTVTAGVIMPPADALLGCVANANFAGGSNYDGAGTDIVSCRRPMMKQAGV